MGTSGARGDTGKQGCSGKGGPAAVQSPGVVGGGAGAAIGSRRLRLAFGLVDELRSSPTVSPPSQRWRPTLSWGRGGAETARGG